MLFYHVLAVTSTIGRNSDRWSENFTVFFNVKMLRPTVGVTFQNAPTNGRSYVLLAPNVRKQDKTQGNQNRIYRREGRYIAPNVDRRALNRAF